MNGQSCNDGVHDKGDDERADVAGPWRLDIVVQDDSFKGKNHSAGEEADDGILSKGFPVGKCKDDLSTIGDGDGKQQRKDKESSSMRAAEVALLKRAGGDGR